MLLGLHWSHAHALYIDTPVNGKLSAKQEVKIYYSEFEDRTVEKVSDWYSDVAQFKLWLIAPDGNRKELATTSLEDHFLAEFVPNQEGIYRLEINHTAEDPGDGTAYQFNAFAQVLVGSADQLAPPSPKSQALSLVEEGASLKNTKTKTFKVYLNGQPKGNVKTTIFLPSGDVKEVESNAKGELKIETNENGRYYLEATLFRKDQAGKTKKAPYKSLWQCATQKFDI